MDGLPIDIAHNLPSSRARKFVDEGEFHHISESEFDDPVTEWEAILGLGKKRRESVVNWLLDVPFSHFSRLSFLTFPSRQVLSVSPVSSDSNVTSPIPSVSSSSSVSCLACRVQSRAVRPQQLKAVSLRQSASITSLTNSRIHQRHGFMRFGCSSDSSIGRCR